MLNKKNISKLLIVLFALTFLIQPAQADASWGHGRSYSRHHSYYHVRYPYPSYGKVVVRLPGSFISVVFGGHRYYYCDGVYYQKSRRDYVVVAPPCEVFVAAVPPDCHPVIIGQATYYTSGNGVYYQSTGEGYVVAEPPAAVTQVAAAAPTNRAIGDPDAFTVNIPNHQAGYTAVTLKKSGTGFVGPQGEFYPAFPSVEQLKVMYGK